MSRRAQLSVFCCRHWTKTTSRLLVVFYCSNSECRMEINFLKVPSECDYTYHFIFVTVQVIPCREFFSYQIKLPDLRTKMRIKQKILMMFLIFLLSSCMAKKNMPKVVILQNPETMDFQNCKVADWGSEKGFQANEECIKGYQQQGYIIWGSM